MSPKTKRPSLLGRLFGSPVEASSASTATAAAPSTSAKIAVDKAGDTMAYSDSQTQPAETQPAETHESELQQLQRQKDLYLRSASRDTASSGETEDREKSKVSHFAKLGRTFGRSGSSLLACDVRGDGARASTPTARGASDSSSDTASRLTGGALGLAAAAGIQPAEDVTALSVRTRRRSTTTAAAASRDTAS